MTRSFSPTRKRTGTESDVHMHTQVPLPSHRCAPRRGAGKAESREERSRSAAIAQLNPMISSIHGPSSHRLNVSILFSHAMKSVHDGAEYRPGARISAQLSAQMLGAMLGTILAADGDFSECAHIFCSGFHSNDRMGFMVRGPRGLSLFIFFHIVYRKRNLRLPLRVKSYIQQLLK